MGERGLVIDASLREADNIGRDCAGEDVLKWIKP